MRIHSDRGGGPICEFDRTVTPMVDVVFQLLVFFVLASGGRIAERTLSTALSAGAVASTAPAASHATQPERPTEIWLQLGRGASDRPTSLRINNGPSGDLAGLPQALRELKNADATASVILDVQPSVPWNDVIQVYDACRGAKFRAINFAASPDELR